MPGTVTVACKLPNGIILRVFDMVEETEMVMGGGTRVVKRAHDRGARIHINGMAASKGKQRLDLQGETVPILSTGFSLTHNVDADHWESWLAANKDTDLVKNGLIFAHGKPVEVRAMARGSGDLRSGLEPMNPDGDARMPRQRTKLKGGVVADFGTAARA